LSKILVVAKPIVKQIQQFVTSGERGSLKKNIGEK
jgi:hypothetical protein